MKFLAALGILLSATAASAAGTGPEIAYVKAGTQDAIYLINPDGSGLRLLYKTPSKMRIFVLDMKPNGGELAFEEVGARSSSPTTLKIVRYDNAGTLLETKTLNSCRILSLDYHPSGANDLLVLDSCSGARRINTVTLVSTPVATPPGINKAAWRTANELLYNRSTAQASEMLVAPIGSPASTTSVGEVRLAQMMDVSTGGHLVLVDPADWGTLSLFAINGGTEQKDWQIGHIGRFSPDDTRVAYVSGYDVRGSYLFIRNLDGSGSPVRLASKGPFGALDWRN